ncbi:hypothetical protein N657DRAFT_650694 [Parathielavia appendiculata]|uniref:Uncharacterized protein n=1 Tax=Parathielavia appendiculata TaxID=2587402 RepID=A0AAN6TS17_9PEZI|nr:hypothetical protein N657DRAFT_650694 [Parathielavia appendiculata]
MSSQRTASSVPFTIDNVLPGMLAFPDSPDIYRIRLEPEHAGAGGPTIKYLTAPNTSKTLTGPDAHLRRLGNLAFDRVPTGDWIVGRLIAAPNVGNDDERKLQLASIEPGDAATALMNSLGLCNAGPVWCGMTVDERDCQPDTTDPSSRWTTVTVPAAADGSEEVISVPKPTALQCMDYFSASIIRNPLSGISIVNGGDDVVQNDEAVLVSDWMPGHWQGIENDVRTYEIIQSRDSGLAPRFLAHVTENGSRVICFLLEHIPDAREAGPADVVRCRAALARLHTLGISKGGRLSQHSFLVRKDEEVLIQGPFAGASVDGDKALVMKGEMESLEEVSPQAHLCLSTRQR